MSDHPDGLAEWISTQLKCLPDQLMLNLIAGDASPRRYYRVTHKAGALPVGAGEVGHPVTSCVAMVSPASENNDAFLHVGSQLAKAGVNTPLVWAQSLPQGWFLLEDFGDEQFLSSVLSDSRFSCFALRPRFRQPIASGPHALRSVRYSLATTHSGCKLSWMYFLSGLSQAY